VHVPRLGRARAIALLAALLAVLTASATIATLAFAQSSANEPNAVVTAYEAARNRGDIDTALSYFADDATVTQRVTVYTGKDEIRRYLESAIARARPVQVTNRRVSGIQLTWQERPTPGQSANPLEVSVQAVVQDGKIKALVFNGGSPQARADQASDGRAQLPALLGLGAVLLVISGVLLVASTGPGMSGRDQPPSRLRGRLMTDLQGWRAARGLNG
jgi:hypothetical protein